MPCSVASSRLPSSSSQARRRIDGLARGVCSRRPDPPGAGSGGVWRLTKTRCGPFWKYQRPSASASVAADEGRAGPVADRAAGHAPPPRRDRQPAEEVVGARRASAPGLADDVIHGGPRTHYHSSTRDVRFGVVAVRNRTAVGKFWRSTLGVVAQLRHVPGAS